MVRVECSDRLVREVVAKQQARDAYLTARGKAIPDRKRVLRVGGVPEYQELIVRPIQLLHRLGVVTTPPIDNLADICSTWAYYRYLWAFALPDPPCHPAPLCLSTHALAIDFHQKGLMSDQIGVGMAALLMAESFGAPDAADVALAVDDDAWDFTLGEASPDYLFFNEDQSRLFVVECKGTRCGRPAAIDQLRRGTEQLPSLQFQDGRPDPTGLVIGTLLAADSVTVLVIDPPRDSGEGPVESYREKSGERTWRIKDAQRFAATSKAVAESKILSFAGDDEAAYQRVANLQSTRRWESQSGRSAPRETSVVENELGEFSGVSESIPVRDAVRVEVFQGIQRGLREAYLANDRDQIAELRAGLKSRRRDGRVSEAGILEPDGLAAHHQESENESTVRSFALDGTFLEMRVRAR